MDVSVFAGLGSEALFSSSTIELAASDASTSHGRLLLKACHRCFCDEVSHADVRLGIDLEDFTHARSLLQPCKRYHRNAIVQHATLCVVQMLRYLTRNEESLGNARQTSVAVSGFCAGLFPAVAVATSRTLLQYLSRAEECFRMAVLLGIASEKSRREINASDSKSPWSLVVDGVSAEDMAQILSSYSPNKDSPIPVYVSSINAHSCVTLSAEGSALQRFVEDHLSSHCRVRPTNLYSLYHNRHVLSKAKGLMLEEHEKRQLRFPQLSDLQAPLVSTVDGSLIDPSSDTSLLNLILDMTLLEPTNWVAVQETILSKAQGHATNTTCHVYNYGPGYGALKGRRDLPHGVQVADASSDRLDQDGFLQRNSSNDIAIVGMGLDLPGAKDTATLWANLMSGFNACSDIPSSRFHVEDYYTGDGSKPVNPKRSMATKTGNFLDNPFLFDNAFFDISPREARSIDPQQRVMLQTAYRALEDAGYVADSSSTCSRETFGCFIGNATLDYTDNLRDEIDVYYSPGTLRAFLAGRISYAFGWSGPSLTIDTACSSSLVAIYQASRALLAGDCNAAIAGGVNVITSPDMYLGLDRAHFLSPTGQCKAFDKTADGYSRAEGCAAFVLKRLEDALGENDQILGIIKGIELNQSGTTHSITHPHSPTQERLFHTLLSRSSIDPHDVSVVEAHGTGTQAGDPNEVGSLRGVLCKSRDPRNPLHITSIKANVGHCEAASGGAALAKLLLMLRHGKIPPQPSLETLNPRIEELGTDGALINQQAASWNVAEGKRRLAMLNNFGAAGSNAALLLQEYIQPATTELDDLPKQVYCFGMSAKDDSTLLQMRDEIVSLLEADPSKFSLDELCYTSTARRQLQKFRLSTSAASTLELASNFKQVRIAETSDERQSVVFLFSGQGSQYLGMGQELMQMFPQFKRTVMRCDQLLRDWGYPSCLEVINPPTDAEKDSKSPIQLQAFQTGIYVLEVAIAQIFIYFGITPDVVAGHSLGEYAALTIAGVMDLEAGLRLVASRARLIIESCEVGATSMLAVNATSPNIREMIEADKKFEGLAISCENSPGDCVVGGKIGTLQQLKEYLSSNRTKSGFLEVPVAYHTAALDPILENLEKLAGELTLSPPKIPVASNVFGRVINVGEDVFKPQYFALHCRQTVAFEQGIGSILAKDDSFSGGQWIEIGPHPALLSMVGPRLSGEACDRMASLRKDKHPSETISKLLSNLYSSAARVDWRKTFEGQSRVPALCTIPLMPFNLTEFRVELKREERSKETENAEPALVAGTPYEFLSKVIQLPDADGESDALFDTPLQQLASYIEGHIVCEYALCPASVYQEMALSAAKFLDASDSQDVVYKVTDVVFERPLLYVEGSSTSVRIVIKSKDPATGIRKFEIFSYDSSIGLDKTQSHCHGSIKTQSASKALEKNKRKERAFERRKATIFNGTQGEGQQTFSGKTMYEKIFTRVVKYSAQYRAVQSIRLDQAAEEVLATCQLPATSGEAVFAADPVLIDTLLHVAGFAANLNVDDDDVCICSDVNSATLLRKDVGADKTFQVHCSNFTNEENGTVLADAYAMDSEGIIAIVKGMQFQRAKLSKMTLAFRHASREPTKAKEPSTKKSHVNKPRPREPSVGDNEESSRSLSVASGTSNTISEPLESGQRSVVELVAETCGVDPTQVTPQTKLEGLGIDSLMMFELEEKLQDALNTQVDSSELAKCQTVRDVEELATPASSQPSSPAPKARNTPNERRGGCRTKRSGSQSFQKRVPEKATGAACFEPEKEIHISQKLKDMLQRRLKLNEQPEVVQPPPKSNSSSTSHSPIFFVHPGAGFCSFYHRLHSLHRATYAIHDPKLLASSSDSWTNIKDIAIEYAKLLIETTREHPDTPILLSGWSFGGIVAYEIARNFLDTRSRPVAGVLLIDAPPPLNHQPLSRDTVEAAMARKSQQQRTKTSPSEFEEAIGQLTVRNNLRAAALLRAYEPNKSGPKPRTILLRSKEGFSIEGVDLPRNEWLDDRSDVRTCVAAWEEVVGGEVKVIDIPGTHFEPFEPENIDEISQAITRACDELEAS